MDFRWIDFGSKASRTTRVRDLSHAGNTIIQEISSFNIAFPQSGGESEGSPRPGWKAGDRRLPMMDCGDNEAISGETGTFGYAERSMESLESDEEGHAEPIGRRGMDAPDCTGTTLLDLGCVAASGAVNGLTVHIGNLRIQ